MTSTEAAGILKRGLESHRLGDLERAGRAYSEVLSNNPLRADALHLLGVIVHQLGDSSSAVSAISRAIALQPNAAHYHSNLGEVYRALGIEDRAAGCREIASFLRPDGFESPGGFDLLIRPDDPTREVATADRPAGRLPSEAAMALVETALRLRSGGDREGAVEYFSMAVQLDPGIGELHSNLGQALLESGRFTEALFHCNEAVRLAPDLPDAWNNLGNVMQGLGRSTEARSNYLEALKLNPRSASALDNLGRVLLEDGVPEESLIWFRQALALDPDSASARSMMASAFKDLGRLEEAETSCEEALALEPESELAQSCLGSIRHEQGQIDDAIGAFRRAIRSNPDFVAAHRDLGDILTESGDFEGAERSYREVLLRPGDHSRAYFGLTSILRGKLPDADLAAIEGLLADPEVAYARKADLHFAAAQVYDARREHARSAEHLRHANTLKVAEKLRTGRNYLPEAHDRFVEEIIAACSKEFFERVEGFGVASDRPVFIFGLPRSGTTLTEQILAGHSRVRGVGELNLARANYDNLPALTGSASGAAECLVRINRDTTVRMADDYLARLDAIDDRAVFVVDKMPENYLYLGLLATLFPRARFIHCRRDLRDTALSCWSTNFQGLSWSSHPDHIASNFAAYLRLMAHWDKVLPVPILRVDYEETVGDPEASARRLLDGCGLDWEPTCLSLHESRNVVRTASATQVRRPIYRHSVGRWRHYQADLGSLFELLETAPTV